VIGPELTIARVIRGHIGSTTEHRVASWPRSIIAQKITYAGGVARAEVLTLDMSGDEVMEREPLFEVTGTSQSLLRRIAPVPAAGVWISDVTEYRLRRYTLDGTQEDSLVRQPAWFPASERFGFGSPDEAPTPGVNALRIDGEGRLWVYIDQPRSNWSAAWRGVSFPKTPFRSDAQEVRVSSLPPSYELWNTIVEVIDPNQRRVVTRKELDGHVFAVLGPDRVATYNELDSGIPVITIHKLSLRER
jgi:hypothetical protein